tara:strand:+ start:1948 stop:2097 length:150 start_codon:yes stop_codon:yes gene_type:complete
MNTTAQEQKKLYRPAEYRIERKMQPFLFVGSPGDRQQWDVVVLRFGAGV